MNDEAAPARVWDLPTRLFHWLLAACVIATIGCAWVGGDAMVWHFRLGYTIFTLLAFRLVWGLVGGHWSRFANFIYAPGAVGRYLRGEPREGEHLDVGHNPLGAFSVFALLALLAAQVGTGFFSDDEISNNGPYTKFVSEATCHLMTRWHKLFGQWTIILLIVLHVSAIAFYVLKKKQDLLRPMIHGDKPLPAGVPASADNLRTRSLAVVLVVLCAVGVSALVALGS